ncbi:hypothetical protein [Halalkalicoccus tibetensis]|uniref:Uncharacterized protein n=1 Tax=Halalkalicoccus tibetensis TaxID=175632 RepID=A0ABD5V939_9EURY
MRNVSEEWLRSVVADTLCVAVSEPTIWDGENTAAAIEIDVERTAETLAEELPSGYGTRIDEGGKRIAVLKETG